MAHVSDNLSTLSILIVEDDKFQQLALTQLLKKLNVTDVRTSDDGEHALKMISSRNFDVVICDLSMPNMDGLALISALAKSKFTGSILVSSALDISLIRSARDLAKKLGLTMLGALHKPIHPLTLSRALAKHFKPNGSHIMSKAKSFNFNILDVEKAIANREIVPYFQPQTCMKTGKLLGVEALARWEHPTHGTIGPDNFIPLAEHSEELINELTEQMFIASLEEMEKLPSAFEKLKLSINISSMSLRDSVIQHLLLNLNQVKNPKKRKVMLELTEQTAIIDQPVALEILARLRMHGFSLSLDDFGTGYSTMEQVSQYPFNELKLHHSFVRKIHHDRNAFAVVESCVKLAKSLGMRVTAEGVETIKQWKILNALGCDQCQGYLVSRPVRVNEIIPTMQAWVANYKTNVANKSASVLAASNT